MKRTALKWILCCASACLLAVTSVAQVDSGTSRDKDASHSKQFCKSKDLVGASVKDSQGQKLGDIKEIYLNPQNGQTIASIDIERGRHALVPMQALTVTPARGAFRNAEVTMSKSKADLEAGPTVKDNEWSNLDDPSFTQKIYSHYNVQLPAGVGGTGTSSGAATGAGATDTKPKEP